MNAHKQPFLFATGIENSYPVISNSRGESMRIDELEKTRHYEHWRTDFSLVSELNLKYLRYGPPLYRVHAGPGKYEWDFVDETFNELHARGIVPIADLCHFGLPDWLGNFQNPDWPRFFAEYARAFAQRFPWVRFYTPVNEIRICAKFSALNGMWNERLKSDRAFVTALKNMARAAQEAILSEQPEALFVQSESSEYFHPQEPDAMQRAQFMNDKRFMALDLVYGHETSALVYKYLTDNGMSRAEYDYQMEHGRRFRPACVLGNDYYVTNEHAVPPGEGEIKPSGEIFGYYIITREYADRYRMPIMHTETNQRESNQDPSAWLKKQWENVLLLRREGYNLIGFTWYSLVDQVDWDSALTKDAGHVNPLGLCDLDRKIRPVGHAYRELTEKWSDVLAAQTQALQMAAV